MVSFQNFLPTIKLSVCLLAPFSYRPVYGQFSQLHVCFCGLDPGNLKFETVRTNKQHICF